jgi:hypothetical protein
LSESSEQVETFCSVKRSQVILLISASETPRGSVISGIAESCSFESGCRRGVLCLIGKRISYQEKTDDLR